MNPKWRHFSRIKASDLLLLDADDEAAMSGPDAPDPSAWCIHGALHRACPLAYATGQKLSVLPPDIAEQTAREWEGYKDSAIVHCDEMKAILDATEPSYAQ